LDAKEKAAASLEPEESETAEIKTLIASEVKGVIKVKTLRAILAYVRFVRSREPYRE